MSWLPRNRWWITRVLILPLHLLVYAIGVFFLVRLIPGDPVYTMIGTADVTPEAYAAAKTSLGLDGSLGQQFVTYIGHLVTLDFGTSLVSKVPVADDLLSRMPATLQLALLAMLVTVVITLVVTYAIVLRPTWLVSRAVAVYVRAAGAIPDFVLGIAGIFVFYVILRWVPAPLGLVDVKVGSPPSVTGFGLVDAVLASKWSVLGNMSAHLVLPVLVMALTYAPMLMKIYLPSLDTSADAPQTRFRVASGSRRRTVHASTMRRALPPVVAAAGTVFGYLIGGAVVIEDLFGMPGVGQYAINAVTSSDLVALQGVLLVIAALSLVSFLFVDLLTMWLDPRRRPGLAV